MNYGNRKAPKLSELLDGVTKKFGNKNVKTNKWYNFQIKEDVEEDIDNSDGANEGDEIDYLNKT